MLGKLLKYELKSYTRVFIPIYIAIIAMSVLSAISGSSELLKVNTIVTMVLVGLFVALFVLSMVIIIQRFRKNLLEDEGYLMFTLPVKTSSIIISKYLAALIFTILSGLVAVLSFSIVMFVFSGLDIIGFVSDYHMMFKSLMTEPDVLKSFIFISMIMFIAYSTFILQIYLSLSMGQLPKFNKHRNLVALSTFFIVNIVINNITSLANKYLPNHFNYERNLSDTTSLYAYGSNYMFIINLIIIGLLFWAITYILNKKLNLE